MRSGFKTPKGDGWQGWFAWRPVCVSNNDGKYCWVWWEHIERCYCVMGPDGWWAYRLPKEDYTKPNW